MHGSHNITAPPSSPLHAAPTLTGQVLPKKKRSIKKDGKKKVKRRTKGGKHKSNKATKKPSSFLFLENRKDHKLHTGLPFNQKLQIITILPSPNVAKGTTHFSAHS